MVSAAAPLMIAVSGGSGSGKTTFVHRLAAACGEGMVTCFQQDHYYRDLSHLTPPERVRVNFDHPNSLDSPLLVQHVRALAAGEAVPRPDYDFTTHCRKSSTTLVTPTPVVVLDGIFSLCVPEMLPSFGLKIYVDVADDLRLVRRLQRDVAERGRDWQAVIDQYLHTVRPMHTQFVEPCRQLADCVVAWERYNDEAVLMLRDRIATLCTS